MQPAASTGGLYSPGPQRGQLARDGLSAARLWQQTVAKPCRCSSCRPLLCSNPPIAPLGMPAPNTLDSGYGRSHFEGQVTSRLNAGVLQPELCLLENASGA